jgi:hypothetical protein
LQWLSTEKALGTGRMHAEHGVTLCMRGAAWGENLVSGASEGERVRAYHLPGTSP